MPELPEVETVVRTLRPQVLECCIERVEVLRERSLHPLSLPVERLAGARRSRCSACAVDSGRASAHDGALHGPPGRGRPFEAHAHHLPFAAA